MPRTRSRLALALLVAASYAAAQRATPIPHQLTFTPYHAGEFKPIQLQGNVAPAQIR